MNQISKVYNLIVLDESGSMESIKKATIDGFNELIQSIKHSEKQDPEIAQYLQFLSFNGAGINEQFPLSPAGKIKSLKEDSYQPDHLTPLYDAIGYSVNSLKKSIETEKDYSVLVTILTDGEENASKEYSFEAVAALIKSLKPDGWVFTYIGANHDVEKTAFSLNINNHLHFTANEEDTKIMFDKNKSSRYQFISKLKTGSKDLDQHYFKEDKN